MIPERVQRWLAPDTPAGELGKRFEELGHRLYLVGGSVRDMFLDRPHDDLDFATDARPEQIKEAVGGWADSIYPVGERFGTIGLVRHQHRYEITTFRRESYEAGSRKPEVAFSDELTTDLSRRDFTINALAIRLPLAEGKNVLEDPWDGLIDLGNKVLRTPLGPEVSFEEDPLRMLRLYRFMATLEFSPEPSTEQAVHHMRHRLAIVSAERIRDELTKLLTAPVTAPAMRALVQSGLAEEFLPELPALALQQDEVHAHKDVLEHTLAVIDNCPPELVLRLAALFHDVGKPATRAFGPEGVSFHNHEVVGARLARERLRKLRFPRQVVESVSQLVALHMRPHTYELGWTDRAVRRYVRDAETLLRELNLLVRADVTTRNRRRAGAIQDRIDELEERIEELGKQEELEALRPPIDGHAVMEYLGLTPGRLVGEAMEMLTEHRIEEGPYSKEEAYVLLDQWFASRRTEAPA